MGKVLYYWEERKSASIRKVESDIAEAERQVEEAKSCLAGQQRMLDGAKAHLKTREALLDNYRLMLIALDRVNPDEMV